MPVISVTYIGSGMGVEVGVRVAVEVGVVRIDARVGELTDGLVVGVGVGAWATAALCPFWLLFSITSAAWAKANERRLPTRVVPATRMNRRIIRALGRWGWFIVFPSIS
jgi:hypothetical protein